MRRSDIAGRFAVLEWGVQTSEPGSRVRDAHDRPVFTHSRVTMSAAFGASFGTVIELVDVKHVRVAWDDGRYSREPMKAAHLVVVRR